MTKEFKLLPPVMPNFITYEMPVGKRQDGFKSDTPKLSVADLTEEEAVQYGELMKTRFIQHWKNKKLNEVKP